MAASRALSMATYSSRHAPLRTAAPKIQITSVREDRSIALIEPQTVPHSRRRTSRHQTAMHGLQFTRLKTVRLQFKASFTDNMAVAAVNEGSNVGTRDGFSNGTHGRAQCTSERNGRRCPNEKWTHVIQRVSPLRSINPQERDYCLPLGFFWSFPCLASVDLGAGFFSAVFLP